MTFDLRLIENSFQTVAKQGELFVNTFYGTLFNEYPETQQLFTDRAASQRKKLLLSLTTIVGALDNPDVLVPYLEQLGSIHQKHHVTPYYYEAFRRVLLQSLAQFLEPHWNEELEQAWGEAYDTVAEIMLKYYE